MLSDLIHWKAVWSSAVYASVIHGVTNTHTDTELRAFARRMSRLERRRFVTYSTLRT